MLLKQKRRFPWIFFIIVIFFVPFLVLLTPEIITMLRTNQSDYIAFISYGKSFILYLISFIITCVILIVFYFIKHAVIKSTIGTVGLFVFIYVNFVGTQYSIYLDENYIEYNPLFGETEKYEWSKVSKVFHELPTEQFKEKYIFEFRDGQLFEFVASKNLSDELRNKIHVKIMSLETSFEEY